MSIAMHAVALVLRLTAKPGSSTAARARARMRKPKGSGRPPAALCRRHDVSVRRVSGFDCWTVRPRGGAATRGAVYVHGGAYTSEIARQHWALIGSLADRGVRVEVPLYGLAPQHTYREAYPLVIEVYRQLLERLPAGAVTLAGDSAGAGLALGVAGQLAAAALPQPRRIILVSPWLDLTLSGPDVRAVARRDPWLTPAGLVEIGRVWAGGDDPSDPRLSPLNGPLTGLAPVTVFIGTRDVFYPGVRRLRERAAAEGVPLDVTVCAGAVHVYPLTPTPEGRAAATRIVEDVSR
ncbi:MULTISPECIES: alpha/beta hydrolase fold domain-containing protein [unclassified Streptomyces]|uniref:alpha/beta hydrolase fold domain-containing protein n=1 Tax=unclassified Streptomyces TaxID=2593676 RepID=UPI0019600775|nr:MULTISPECIES: alpha/beta hydrolase [unclassified Streptomyces]